MHALPRLRWLWVLLAGVLLLVAVGARAGQGTLPDPGSADQPVAFGHNVHAEAQIPCLYCHSDATRTPQAGLPSVQKCLGCHQVIAAEEESVQPLVGFWERDEPLPWHLATWQPEFVYFSHAPHLGAGLNCESCHGDVARMQVVEPPVEMDMGWCLDCHEAQPAEKIGRLVDCITCHK